MIAMDGWKSMESAPKDGTIIMVRYREFGTRDGKIKVQASQWLCDEVGEVWTWRAPWRPGTATHADGWMTYTEFLAAQTNKVEAFDL